LAAPPRKAAWRMGEGDDLGTFAVLFRALGDPVRSEIVARAATMEELPCTLLESVLPISKSTISYHIKVLYQAELLEVRKEGRFYHYKLREDVLARYLPDYLGRIRSPEFLRQAALQS
jgi:ArsR family transcriptional regulator, arsenate/arsenite/antimonite-responsive transcriptional repressor